MIPLRNQVPIEHTWDAASIFATDALFEKGVEHVLASLPKLDTYKGRLGENARVLLECFKLDEDLTARTRRIGVYANMLFSVDSADPRGLALKGRAGMVSSKLSAAASFIEPELLAIGFEKLRDWMKVDAQLAVYAHYFDALEKRSAHVRSPEVESLLSQVSEPFGSAVSTHGILNNGEMRFEPVGLGSEEREIIQGNVGALVSDENREVRRQAWEHYNDGYLALKNTIASIVTTGVKQAVFMARARGYGSTREASLSRNHIPIEVFDNLLATYQKHLPTWHRYWRVRKRALKLDALREYDIKAPLTRSKLVVPFEQAIEWICEGMRPLGEEYVRVMRRGLVEQRWVDRYPNKGKRMGAFSTGTHGTHPFIFISYNDDIYSMSTLAHELGHSMHKYFTHQTQPQVYASYTLFAAEVASNFNQAMVREHLLKTNKDRDFQIAVIEEAMSNFHRYFFVMPTVARFEHEIHERTWGGESLTAQKLSELMLSLYREGYGQELDIDEARVGINWAQWPNHIYSYFYVYQYATGISGAHALCDRVLSRGSSAAEEYLNFLRAGSSLYPLDALKRAGVDMATSEPVEKTFAVLSRYVDRLEELTA